MSLSSCQHDLKCGHPNKLTPVVSAACQEGEFVVGPRNWEVEALVIVVLMNMSEMHTSGNVYQQERGSSYLVRIGAAAGSLS